VNRGLPITSRGWTLVELLVAMTLSLLVIAGIGQIYLAAKRSYEIQANLAQIQDVGRYVTEVLTRDIRNAGYWGLMDIDLATSTPTNDGNPGGAPTGDSFFLSGWQAPGGCDSDDTWGRMITQKIFGINDGNGIAAYNCIGGDLSTPPSDILTVRYAHPASVTTFDPAGLYLRSAPFQGIVTHGNPATAIAAYSPASLDLVDPVFSNHALVTHAYYVADSIATECGNVPVFARKTLDSNGTPRKESLVNGVEQLQFQYGVDTDSDDSVNRYLNANEVTDWSQVRAVRFWVLVRADCPEGGFTNSNSYNLGDLPPYIPNDGFRRALYASNVALLN
jgi:type IV pilus assembly protein PilW